MTKEELEIAKAAYCVGKIWDTYEGKENFDHMVGLRVKHLIELVRNYQQPSIPSDLDEAAEKYASNRAKDPEQCYEYLYYEIIDAVRFGAELMAGQGYSQEEIVEDKSIEVGYGVLPGISPIINLPNSFKPGDKVIIQIRKKQ